MRAMIVTSAVVLSLGLAAEGLSAQQSARDTLPRPEEIEEKMARLRREMDALRAQQRELDARDVSGQMAREARRITMSASGPTMTICEYRDRRPDGWLGISFAPPRTATIVRGRGPVLTFSGPIAVDEVLPASPAARAGLAVGDSIIAFNGEAVAGRKIAFESLLKPGTALAVQARRAGKTRDFKVEITPRPGNDREPCREIPMPAPFMRGGANPLVDMVFEFDSVVGGRRVRGREVRGARGNAVVVVPGAPDMPEPPRPPGFTYSRSYEVAFLFGAQLGALTEELQDLTGVKRGVFVTSVAEGSPAAGSGLKTADVLQKVGEVEVTSPGDARRAIAGAEKSATLSVVRKKKPLVLTVNW